MGYNQGQLLNLHPSLSQTFHMTKVAGHLPSTLLRSMSLIYWNCKGLGNLETLRAFKALVIRCRPISLFIMEMKLQSKRLMRLQKYLGFEFYNSVEAVGTTNGLLLLWHSDINLKLIEKNNHMFRCVVFGDQYYWRVFFFVIVPLILRTKLPFEKAWREWFWLKIPHG